MCRAWDPRGLLRARAVRAPARPSGSQLPRVLPLPIGSGARTIQSFPAQPIETADVSLFEGTVAVRNCWSLFGSPRNRTQEADGSIPFSSTRCKAAPPLMFRLTRWPRFCGRDQPAGHARDVEPEGRVHSQQGDPVESSPGSGDWSVRFLTYVRDSWPSDAATTCPVTTASIARVLCSPRIECAQTTGTLASSQIVPDRRPDPRATASSGQRASGVPANRSEPISVCGTPGVGQAGTELPTRLHEVANPPATGVRIGALG